MRREPAILALADDMTGALEIGAKFSGAGIETTVSAKPVTLRGVTALVLDTETRHLDAASAATDIQRFVEAAAIAQPLLVYKKTDSTLRGHIGAELAALAKVYPDWTIGYAPAYPALGRTVVAGHLYVDGVPVSQTEFARDALNPVLSSSVLSILSEDLPCTVFDGETDAHLSETARTILSDGTMRIAAGPSGLAEMLAAAIDVPRKAPPSLPIVRTCLVLNGSLHASSAIQVRNCNCEGWTAMRLPPQHYGEAPQVAQANAQSMLTQVAVQRPDAIFVIGGDTTFAIIRELGFPMMRPLTEAVPGVPVTSIAAEDLREALPGRQQDLVLITKAGGFGHPDVMARVQAQLRGDHEK